MNNLPIHGRGLRSLAIVTAVCMIAALTLIFFYAPNDADQGFIQKIFYIHVPMAIVALVGFTAGGIMGIAHLRTGKRVWDVRSYVAIHLSIILGVAVLVTGAIWAKGSWGHWWVWEEPTLVSFLIVFLLYCTYQPLRFSIEDPDKQARYASVFAIVAGSFVPLNFAIVRLAQAHVHPRVFASSEGGMPGQMQLTFLVSFIAITLLFVTLWKLEMSAKHASARLRTLKNKTLGQSEQEPLKRRSAPSLGVLAAPAVPLNTAGQYVVAAYLVLFALVVIYVAIMARKLSRMERELAQLADLAALRDDSKKPQIPTDD